MSDTTTKPGERVESLDALKALLAAENPYADPATITACAEDVWRDWSRVGPFWHTSTCRAHGCYAGWNSTCTFVAAPGRAALTEEQT